VYNLWVTARDPWQLSWTRNAKCGIPEATAHLHGLRGHSYLWIWIKQIGAKTSEEGSLKRTVYGKVLPETISSQVFGELWVQSDKGASAPLLLCFFTRGWLRSKGRAASAGAGAYEVQGKTW